MAVGWTVEIAVPLPPSAVLAVMPVVLVPIHAVGLPAGLPTCVEPDAVKMLTPALCPCPGSTIVVAKVTAGRFACAIVTFAALETAPTVAPFRGVVISGVDGNTDTRALLRRSGVLNVVVPLPPHVPTRIAAR